jgi:hypothetical protein
MRIFFLENKSNRITNGNIALVLVLSSKSVKIFQGLDLFITPLNVCFFRYVGLKQNKPNSVPVKYFCTPTTVV